MGTYRLSCSSLKTKNTVPFYIALICTVVDEQTFVLIWARARHEAAEVCGMGYCLGVGICNLGNTA